MIANRDYECINCGKVTEARGTPTMGLRCPACSSVSLYVMTLSKAQPPTDALWPMVHPNLGDKPVEVKGWGHFNSLLKARGLTNPLAG